MTDNHYPWNELGIDETDDKKLIKKAYAVLIKQYKPDENPEEFKEIQEAYKYALDILKWDFQNELKVKPSIDAEEQTSIELNQNSEENLTNKNEQEIANNLISNLNNLLKIDQNKIDLMKNWNFIKLYNNIFDIQLKRNLSYQVFEKIAQFNLKYQEDKNRPVIHLSIVQHLDEIFDWSTNWQGLLNQFPNEYIEVTLQRTEKKVNLDGIVTPIISRALGFYLDYIFSILIIFMVKWISFKLFLIKYEEDTLSYLLISIFFIQRILMESIFPSRRSIGKIARSLFIIDLNGFYINFKKSLDRHNLIALNLTPYFLYLFKVEFEELVYLAMIITIIAVNLISYFSKGCLLHDLITKTRILEPDQ